MDLTQLNIITPHDWQIPANGKMRVPATIIAEEAPGAYNDLSCEVETDEKAGLASRVARLTPLICIKG